jgi:hypothetical protein
MNIQLQHDRGPINSESVQRHHTSWDENLLTNRRQPRVRILKDMEAGADMGGGDGSSQPGAAITVDPSVVGRGRIVGLNTLHQHPHKKRRKKKKALTSQHERAQPTSHASSPARHTAPSTARPGLVPTCLSRRPRRGRARCVAGTRWRMR